MVARLVVLRRAIDHLHSDGVLTSGFSSEEWLQLCGIAEVLTPFMAIQKNMEGEKYVTISLVPFLLHQVSTISSGHRMSVTWLTRP